MSSKESTREIQERLAEFKQNQALEEAKPLIHKLKQDDLSVRTHNEYMKRLNNARKREASKANNPPSPSGDKE